MSDWSIHTSECKERKVESRSNFEIYYLLDWLKSDWKGTAALIDWLIMKFKCLLSKVILEYSINDIWQSKQFWNISFDWLIEKLQLNNIFDGRKKTEYILKGNLKTLFLIDN